MDAPQSPSPDRTVKDHRLGKESGPERPAYVDLLATSFFSPPELFAEVLGIQGAAQKKLASKRRRLLASFDLVQGQAFSPWLE
jgi:hypothetical protein